MALSGGVKFWIHTQPCPINFENLIFGSSKILMTFQKCQLLFKKFDDVSKISVTFQFRWSKLKTEKVDLFLTNRKSNRETETETETKTETDRESVHVYIYTCGFVFLSLSLSLCLSSPTNVTEVEAFPEMLTFFLASFS